MNKKNRKAEVFFKGESAGIIEETDDGYIFVYDKNFAAKGKSISVSMPSRNISYKSPNLFSFFKGLLPEGWYLDIVSMKLKIDKNDDFGLLLATCADTAGAVSIKRAE